MHVRHQSWSCSALDTYEKAFYRSGAETKEADTCGYCGENLARSGIAEHDEDKRVRRHLEIKHRFGKCNSMKNFYRVDHFRQHLKHSHAGVRGEWMEVLEDLCMVEGESPSTGHLLHGISSSDGR